MQTRNVRTAASVPPSTDIDTFVAIIYNSPVSYNSRPHLNMTEQFILKLQTFQHHFIALTIYIKHSLNCGICERLGWLSISFVKHIVHYFQQKAKMQSHTRYE